MGSAGVVKVGSSPKWRIRAGVASVRYPLRGEKHPQAKLSWGKVAIIKGLLHCGRSCRSIAKLYDVDPSTIRQIKNGETWKREVNDA